MVRPETICGFGMANDSSIIHAALQKYMERKIKNVEDSITNKLVLRLPFESESKCSNLLLGHVNGIVCPMAQPPKNKDPMYASRSLQLTFKEKSSNFHSKKKATVKHTPTPMPFSSAGISGDVKRSANNKNKRVSQDGAQN